MPLIQITAPVGCPVSHADILPAIRADGNEFDSQLDFIIPAITQAAESKLGRKLINQTLELILDSFPTGHIDLQYPNATGITSIKYLDQTGQEQTLAPANYRLISTDHDSKVSLAQNNSWPAVTKQPGAVRIRFICGYGEDAEQVPTAIRLWIISQCVAAINNPDGLAAKDMASLDYVDALLTPFIVWRAL